MKKSFFALLSALLPLAFLACDVGSTDSVTGSLSDSSGTIYDFSGTYYPVEDAETLVNPPSAQSGKLLTWIRLVQYGSKLEGYDNAKKTWSGKITSVSSGGNAPFTLSGSTTTGHSVEIIGTLRYADGASTMDGSWIEDVGNAASIYAKAAVAAPATNSSSSTTSLTISPSSKSVSFGSSATFTASGGTSPYSWALSTTSYGTLSTSSGSSTTFTATSTTSTSSKTITLTVTDSASDTASATITVSSN
jgi:hypothetical protein